MYCIVSTCLQFRNHKLLYSIINREVVALAWGGVGRKKEMKKGREDIWGHNRCICYLDCSSSTDVHIYENSANYTF